MTPPSLALAAMAAATLTPLAGRPAMPPALAETPPAARTELTLVMPFEPVGDHPALAWLPEGCAILLDDALKARGVATLGRPLRDRLLSELGLPLGTVLSRASIIRLGTLVGASRVVLGTLRVERQRLGIDIRLVHLEPPRAEAPFSVDGPLEDLFGTFDRVADRLAPVNEGPPPASRMPLDAFERFVKGLLLGTGRLRVESLSEAVARAPGAMPARVALWEALTEAGDPESALEVVRGVASDSPAWRQARLLSARSLVALGRLDEAFEILQPLRKQSDDAALYAHLGFVQLSRGSADGRGRATSYYQQVVDRMPGDPDAAFNLGYAYWTEGDAAAAVYWLRRAVELRPTDAVARFVLGLALGRTGRVEAGVRERALARRLSSIVAAWGHGEAAVAPAGLERLPRPASVAVPADLEGRLRAAAAEVTRRLGRYHLEQGRILFEAHRDEAALQELDRALRLTPELPDAFLLAARLRLRAGRVEEAIELLRLAPASPEVAVLRERIRAGAR